MGPKLKFMIEVLILLSIAELVLSIYTVLLILK